MTIARESEYRTLPTADGVQIGGETLAELAQDLSSAVADAYWSFMLRADLEEAFDTALLRAAMAGTPVLSGLQPI